MEIKQKNKTTTKNLVDKYHNREEITEDRITELDNQSIEFTQTGQQRKIDLKNNKQSLRELWNKSFKIHILRIPEERRNDGWLKKY